MEEEGLDSPLDNLVRLPPIGAPRRARVSDGAAPSRCAQGTVRKSIVTIERRLSVSMEKDVPSPSSPRNKSIIASQYAWLDKQLSSSHEDEDQPRDRGLEWNFRKRRQVCNFRNIGQAA